MEILVVIAIMGILLKIGTGYIRSDRIAVGHAATLLVAQVNRARLEAIKANTFAGITITTSGNGGYVLWVDQNNNRTYNQGTDTALQTYSFGTGDLAQAKRSSTTSSTLSEFVFDSRGIPQNGSAGYVVIDNLANNYRKVVCVTAQGRTAIATSTSCP